MKIGFTVVLVAAAASIMALPGCAGREGEPTLYVLEELEAARSASDLEERLERLALFVKNHPSHPYRLGGYGNAIVTMQEDMGDSPRAARYLEDVLRRENDPYIRAELIYTRFAHIWKTERQKALSLAGSLLAGPEKSSRLFRFMGWRLAAENGESELAERCFRRAVELSNGPVERSSTLASLASHIVEQGRKEEALRYLEEAAGNVFADELYGRLLWEKGRRKEALEAFTRLTAVMPGARGKVALDSLNALVHGGDTDLEEMIMDRRIRNEGPLPDASFVDIEGKAYKLSDFRGEPLVISIWSPT